MNRVKNKYVFNYLESTEVWPTIVEFRPYPRYRPIYLESEEYVVLSRLKEYIKSRTYITEVIPFKDRK